MSTGSEILASSLALAEYVPEISPRENLISVGEAMLAYHQPHPRSEEERHLEPVHYFNGAYSPPYIYLVNALDGITRKYEDRYSPAASTLKVVRATYYDQGAEKTVYTDGLVFDADFIDGIPDKRISHGMNKAIFVPFEERDVIVDVKGVATSLSGDQTKKVFDFIKDWYTTGSIIERDTYRKLSYRTSREIRDKIARFGIESVQLDQTKASTYGGILDTLHSRQSTQRELETRARTNLEEATTKLTEAEEEGRAIRRGMYVVMSWIIDDVITQRARENLL